MNNNLSRRDFLKAVGFSAASLTAAALTAATGSASVKRPVDIVIFLSDDHGCKDCGCYGNKVVKTPNIDRLAAEGMKFNLAFTATAMCSPSRSTLYTGLYPHRHGCHMNHGAIRPGVKALPDYLNPLGYRVALAGKRHINPPKQFGFEYMDSKPDTIKKFIESAVDKPFCLIVAISEPHAPPSRVFPETKLYDPEKLRLPPYLVDTAKTRLQRAGYYDLVTEADRKLGDVLKVVEESGRREDTCFIYTSDHGGGFCFEKWTCYDAGLKVPFIARWPGKIRFGSVTDAMISFVDIVPTCIEIAAGRPPTDLDSRSFLDVLKGKKIEHNEIILGAHTTHGIFSGSIYPVRCIRTKRYKYIRNLNPEGVFKNLITEGSSQGGWESWKQKAKTDAFAAKLVHRYQHRPAEELYDLVKDPYELNNLAFDSACEKIKSELSRKLDEWMEAQGDLGLEAEKKVPYRPDRRKKTG